VDIDHSCLILSWWVRLIKEEMMMEQQVSHVLRHGLPAQFLIEDEKAL